MPADFRCDRALLGLPAHLRCDRAPSCADRRSKEELSSTAAYWLHWSFGVQPIFDAFRTVTGAEPKVPWKDRFAGALGQRGEGDA